MIIEIRRAGFINKGAELMLYSVIDKLKEKYPDAIFVMEPTGKDGPQPYHKIVQLGFYPKASFWKYRFQWGRLAEIIPQKIRERFGLILDKEIDIVIDAAGFAYSEQWGSRACHEISDACKRWKKQGTKVVLLPQALGPYDSPEISKDFRAIADNVGLIFPRERMSYEYVRKVVGERNNIILKPDFTNLIKGEVPKYFNAKECNFCIVPNYRMIDKTDKAESSLYVPFLINCAKYLLEKNVKPFILVHEGEADLALANQISTAVGNIPIITENDALKIKGILGQCYGTIGSRFHGLVSALSQGVPSLATGWSHKYAMLFEDYGFPDGLLNVKMAESELKGKIDLIIDNDSRENIKSNIISKGNELKQQSEEMWSIVFNYLDAK
ncbi:polysaccharide pyruvyl transferase family protein [Brenneria goodwinii]|uniref:polysaccharide pyruvyl transferase family protein n=1 Tax=Brenneria goodwinii TaxID=1109412 RepID=UPI000EF231AC|nr:polysaccharide pyruvyl transferase family protein [Brenneria goodwinii]MCG8158729.1 polysaccharide pyruvyl transferase family protein [Brenneria goodwinii]MCG8163256.1 polysaccharide pyruvyl transferase family protein [Brenneria goodwinii]MCG8167677.1 polysaccharide pyruvyl transferase family protein [Brenneria goodwinii]MCG8170583.1 polysaccharide pyruvyl transferase family protein [Brenneria goodwinii]MCG8174417.1 polysaccharide pyruvyl transferase family protein [Brenneria goodwinii]